MDLRLDLDGFDDLIEAFVVREEVRYEKNSKCRNGGREQSKSCENEEK